MANLDPIRHFQCGISLFQRGRFEEAARQFEAGLVEEKRRGSLRPTMRAISYLALSRSLFRRPTHEEIESCEWAARKDGFDPDVLANLGHIYLLAGKTSRGLNVLERGLAVDPRNRRIREIIASSNRRAQPVIPKLSRNHPINRSLGRLRASLQPASRS